MTSPRPWHGWLSVLAMPALFTASGCGVDVACPAALLTGTLVAQDHELVIQRDEPGQFERVDWPVGYSTREDSGSVVLIDASGSIKARPGQRIALGGGESSSGTWKVCGRFDVGLDAGTPFLETPPPE